MSKVGIYKITSPTGKVYIGQSVNITNRFTHYKYMCRSIQKQAKLYASLIKYGWDAHTTKIIHELPNDVCSDILTAYEQLYMDFYKNCGIELMNLKEAGSHGLHTEETKLKISQSEKGKIVSEETRAKLSAVSKGNSFFAGRNHSEKSKLKMRESAIKRGNCFGEITEERKTEMVEAARKMREVRKVKNNPHWLLGKHHSQETKEKVSKSKLGCKGTQNRKVVCSATGIIYDSIKEAAISIGMKPSTLVMQLREYRNKTSFNYLTI